MIRWFVRMMVVVAGALVGWAWPPLGIGPVAGALAGTLLAAVLAGGLALFERGTPGTIFGLIAGFVVAAFLAGILNSLIFGALGPEQARGLVAVRYVIIIAFCATGTTVGVRCGRWLTPENLKSVFDENKRRRRYKILDTSVIIDGRIADICETGFLDGVLVVPQFVLGELQHIADSSHSLKRNRGRRGLEILQRIQKQAGVLVQISEQDFPDISEVDLKLIEMARQLGGKIVTNDFNLNKVAQLRGVEVLNINELANAVKPVVLPGEIMRVFLLKEGKEAGQAVGYLDDGTMVVVDNARHLIGATVDLAVTSVLQTTAGKMIFGRTEDDGTVSNDMPHPDYSGRNRNNRS